MTVHSTPEISIVVPLFNEADGVAGFDASLRAVLEKLDMSFEIIYVDDGSTDRTQTALKKLAKDSTTRVLCLVRNFGKEVALTAGIREATGRAIITIDGDGQHPVELIPEFIAHWKSGARVVTGVYENAAAQPWLKRQTSRLFYVFFRMVTSTRLRPGATDFRLIDRSVQRDFLMMTERNRITRGLIDWLGYDQEFVPFTIKDRLAGSATYSYRKLFHLAIDSIVSLSISPLYLSAYIGAVVLPLSALLGITMVINWLVGDPWNLHITGGAYLGVFTLFLVGVLLVSQGIIGIYLSQIHTETQNRPLYIIDEQRSIRS